MNIIACVSAALANWEFYNHALAFDEYAEDDWAFQTVFVVTGTSMCYFGAYHPVLIGCFFIALLYCYSLKASFDEEAARTLKATTIPVKNRMAMADQTLPCVFDIIFQGDQRKRTRMIFT